MSLEIVYRRPRRAAITVRVPMGRMSRGIVRTIYDMAAPCVPDQVGAGRDGDVFRFWVDGDAPIAGALEQLRALEAGEALRYSVAFGSVPEVRPQPDAAA